MDREKELYNPFVSKKYPHLAWRHLQIFSQTKQIYEIEMIQPLKAMPQSWSFYGGFITVCIEVLADAEKPEITKGDFMLLDLPIRTMEREMDAWNRLRKNLTEHDNLKLKFKKPTRESVTFLTADRVVPTQEQLDFANEYYKNQNEKTIAKNEVEEI